MPLRESIDLLSAQMEAEEPLPETMSLLRSVWPTLTTGERLALLRQLGSPPSDQEVQRWNKDKALHRRLLRQWRWLAGVSEDLPEAWKPAYENLATAFGAGDPEARRFHVSVRVGSISALSAQEIAELGPERFADWLSEWKLPTPGWETPTPNGIASELSKAVQDSPSVWVGVLPNLLERLRHPTYIRAMLEGLREALKVTPQDVAWDRLIPALELVASEPWEVERLTEDEFHADRDWASANRVVVQLIQEAADRDTPFDKATLNRLWSVLRTNLRRRALGSGVSDTDLLTTAINKLSTIALQAMFSIALSVSRRGIDLTEWGHLLSSAVSEELSAGDSEAEVARGIVASLYPQFVHICGTEADDFIPQLFGTPEPTELRIEALETLVKWARPISNEMLIRFKPYVLTYLRTTSSNEDDEVREAIRWLMIGYMRRIKGHSNASRLIGELRQPSRISEGAEFFGRVLRETPEAEPALVEAALRFWDEAIGRPGLEGAAFQGFGWWAEAEAINDTDWLDRLHMTLELTRGRIDWEEEVVKRLARLGSNARAWRALILLVKGAEDRWEVSYWARNLHDLFGETEELTGDIPLLRVELAERLLERELLEFRRYTHR